MLPPVTKKCEDHSTDRYFCFAFYCDACGAIWESELYPFSMRNTPSQSEGEKNARIMLWKAEHDAAYERANLEAMLNFNKCRCCGRRVCDDCFSEFEAICQNCENSKKTEDLK